MRLATFNLESLDLGPKAQVALETRAAVLRPALERVAADILCLQEVNGQHLPGKAERQLIALERLLEGTPYQHYARATTTGPSGRGVADVHNLVTLSRFAIVGRREVLHELVPPPMHTGLTAQPGRGEQAPVRFDRPLLLTEIALPRGGTVAVINAHLRAPLASPVAGQKNGAVLLALHRRLGGRVLFVGAETRGAGARAASARGAASCPGPCKARGRCW